MKKIEKILKGLEEISDEAYSRWVHSQYTNDKLILNIGNNIQDAIEILKEQQTKITQLQEIIDGMPNQTKLLDIFNDNYTEVVRCKDCKYSSRSMDMYLCRKNPHRYGKAGHNPEWFCADGETE